MQQAYTLKALITNTICADMSLRERGNHRRRRKGQTLSPKKGPFCARQWADSGHRTPKRASSPKNCTFLRRRWFMLSGRILKCIVAHPDTLRINTLMFEIN